MIENEQAESAIAEALQTIRGDYGFCDPTVETSRGVTRATLHNATTFLQVTWSPKDGFGYYVGPMVDGSVPEDVIIYKPGRQMTRYELHQFNECFGQSPALPACRGSSTPLGMACANGVQHLVSIAGVFLKGDWSQRDSLDRAIAENYWRRDEGRS